MEINMNGPMFIYTIMVLIIILVIYYVFVQNDKGESFTDKEKETIAKVTMDNKHILKESKQSYTDLKHEVPILNAPAFDKINNLYRDDMLSLESIKEAL